ncbi:transglycosylase domain-containing protein [Parapedobacter sp. 10938]|uniref:transglycosylase domain-containing protein n=1 Tax=Parapedobacter flavus TaxID=3110225 RepID=UPI002DBDE9AD|nr:transglycosylase domain-containing protein [Parapedobacter sp. 10938]MEC3880819.1 transglycosylase domain-containing protein [Parapedobacter sp. 10938]
MTINIVKQFLNRITRRQLIVGGAIIGTLVVAGIVAGAIAYHKREALLAATLARIQSKLANEYQIDLEVGNAHFSGLTTVTFEQVALTPRGRDQLAGVEELSVGIKLFPLLTGDVRFGRLRGRNAKVQLIKKDSISNYDFLFRRADTLQASPEPTGKQADEQTVNLAQAANQMLNNVLYKIPEDMDLRDFIVTYRDDSTEQRINVPQADIDNGNLTASVFLNDNEAAWQVSGKLNPNRRQLYIKVHANGERIALPLLERKLGLKLSFDTIETRLREVYWTHNELLHIKGEWAVKNLHINHWRIAQEDVAVPDAHIDAEVIVGDSHVELSNESTVTVENLVVHPFVRYTTQPQKTYALGLETPEMDAQDLFDAFPKGLFESLEGIRVSGRIKYKLDAFLDTANPDSVRFDSRMEQHDFNVNAWGKANIPEINTAFTYTPYEDGQPVRDIVVGPENPNFVPLAQVSPYLKNAILTTEDPSFFSHEGFVEEAIRSSIAINFKEKAFKRGGSTISMQLVKNVFLNRNKTMARKLEEILIVWLMESTEAVSKDRMYEVYLNIIEWGRNVYGVTEAARYYFGKHPSQLNLGESIYLASIVPRPKTGLYSFNYQGQLKPYIASYFGYIGNIMARRGLAPADSSGSYGFYAVNLRESLRPDRPATDTLQLELPPTDFEQDLEQVRGLLNRIFNAPENENP